MGPLVTQPAHRNEHTGEAGLDRIQNNVRALIEAFRAKPWALPASYEELTASTTIATSASYATLLSCEITTRTPNSYLLMQATASMKKLTAIGTAFLVLIVDGVTRKGFYVTAAAINYVICGSIIQRVAVTPGTHTVLLKWRTDSSSLRIDPVSTVEEHASLRVSEVLA